MQIFGIGNQKWPKSGESGTPRDKAPIEEKESYRWLQSYLKACEIAKKAPETQIVNITDREGDIIEIFEASIEKEKQGSFAYFIIRSQYDRFLTKRMKKRKYKKN